tara:strand:- start:7027 stop:7509 length:483 start_codon:yes stop_codon:yes gene_type:complete
MSIISSEIKLFRSTNSLGGAITVDEVVDGVLHNLFDKVTSDESAAGDTEYRCAYVQNTHGTITLEEAISYIAANTASTTTAIRIAVGTSAVGGIEQAIVDESTAPAGVTFVTAVDIANAIALGDIPAGSHRAIWFERVVDAGTLATPIDGITLTTRGSTV